MWWCAFLKAVADHIPQLVQGMRSSQAQPEDLSAQLALIIASQSFLQVQIKPQSYSFTYSNHTCLFFFKISNKHEGAKDELVFAALAFAQL